MNMTRRDFLKSMLAVATVAALPAVTDPGLFEEIEQFLVDGGEPEIPQGQWGTLRLGDKWYALDGASIASEVETQTLEGDDGICARYNRITAVAIDCVIAGSFADDAGYGGIGATHDFELVVANVYIHGMAHYGWGNLGDGRTFLHMMVLMPLEFTWRTA